MLDPSMRIPFGLRLALTVSTLAAIAVLPIRAEAEPSRRKILAAVRELGIRRENSPGERALFDFLESEAGRRSLPTSSIPIAEYSEKHSFSRILEVRIPGTGDGTLALVFPATDAGEWGDGAAGIAAALELMDRLARTPPPLEVRFAFPGADEEFKGSQAYAAYCADESSLAVLRIEVSEGPADAVELRIGGTGSLSPYWLLEAAVQAVRGLGLRDLVNANRSMIQRLGLTDDRTPLDPWFREDIPALTLRMGAGPDSDNGPGPAGAVTVMEKLLRSLENGIPDRWDRQYVLFEAMGIRLAIRETLYVAIILSLYAALGLVFVMDSLRRRDIIADELGRVPRGAAALLMVFVALYFCVLTTGLFQALVLRAAGSPEFWKVHPAAFSALRIGQLLTLFIALASLGARLRLLPRKAEFFRGSAIFVLGADVLLVSSVRLSLSLVFLWAFITAMLGRRLSRTTKSTWPAALALPVVLAPLAVLAVDLAGSPELAVFERFLMPGIVGIAYLGFLALPFLLLVVGLGEGLFGAGFYKIRTSMVFGFVFLVLSVTGGFLILADARGFRGTTEISVREFLNQDSRAVRIRIESPRPLPSFRLFREGWQAEVSGGSSTEFVDSPSQDSFLSVSVSRELFLDRTKLNLSVSADDDPSEIRILISSPDSGSMYDSSFPFRSTEDGKGVEVYVGARPPDPVVVSLTVSRDFSASALVTAEYRFPASSLGTDGFVKIIDHLMETRTTVLLRGGRDPFP